MYKTMNCGKDIKLLGTYTSNFDLKRQKKITLR